MTRLRDEVQAALSTGRQGVHTQRELAPIIGVTPGQLSRILDNPARRLRPGQAAAFASFLGASVEHVARILRDDLAGARSPDTPIETCRDAAGVDAARPAVSLRLSTLQRTGAPGAADFTIQVTGADRDLMVEYLSAQLHDVMRLRERLDRLIAEAGPLDGAQDEPDAARPNGGRR
jgi:hypothetical protein